MFDRMRLAVGLIALCPIVALSTNSNSRTNAQTLLAENGDSYGLAPSIALASLSSGQFSTISHTAFPGHSARIKKSNFCDGNVTAYTGYIDSGTRHLFFYFFESRNDPDNDDVMLWTNGGPGSSSALGLLTELGPCNIVSENETKYNPYSWNSNANIFFIDQPVGTGFSYAGFGETVSTTEEAAKDIASFIAIFLEVFKNFKGRALHLSGESYAGRYLPLFATAIYDQNAALIEKGISPINLKSILIGNGATDIFNLLLSYHSISCTRASLDPVQSVSVCVRMKQIMPRCEKRLKEVCIDHFDKIDYTAIFKTCWDELAEPYNTLGLNHYDMTMKCDNPAESDCYDEQRSIEEYLNDPSVRVELGVESTFGNYSGSAMDVGLAFLANGDLLHTNQVYVSELLEHDVKVLIYAGTYDWVCNWVGNERWTLDMEWSGQEAFRNEALGEWYVDGKAAGKFRKHGNLAFATIYGAGHLLLTTNRRNLWRWYNAACRTSHSKSQRKSLSAK